MGKGDKKSFRGKIWRGSYGVTRPHHPPATGRTTVRRGGRKGPTR
jgi:ribosomal small subunit protein bTHX